MSNTVHTHTLHAFLTKISWKQRFLLNKEVTKEPISLKKKFEIGGEREFSIFPHWVHVHSTVENEKSTLTENNSSNQLLSNFFS